MSDASPEIRTARVGEPLTFSFNEASGAGYLWTCAADLAVDVAKEYGDEADNEGIGGPLEAVFTLKAAQPGDYEVAFMHRQPWKAQAAEIVRYTLRVMS